MLIHPTVLSQLKEKKLKGGKDDSAVVVRYADAVFKPMQGPSLLNLAPRVGIKTIRLNPIPSTISILPNHAEKLATLAPKIKLPLEGEGAEEKQKRLETLPFLLKGHLLELAAACRSGDAAEQLEEMEVRGVCVGSACMSWLLCLWIPGLIRSPPRSSK